MSEWVCMCVHTHMCTVYRHMYCTVCRLCCICYQPSYHPLQEVISSRDGHKTIGKKLGKMFSKFRTRGKSLSLDNSPGPTAKAKANLPPSSPSADLSDEEEDPDDEVRYACRNM